MTATHIGIIDKKGGQVLDKRTWGAKDLIERTLSWSEKDIEKASHEYDLPKELVHLRMKDLDFFFGFLINENLISN